MTVDAKVKWSLEMNNQRAINDMNRMLRLHDKEIQKLRQKLGEAKKADRLNRKTARSGGLFGGVKGLATLVGAHQLVSGIFSMMSRMQGMQIRAFEGLKGEQNTLRALGQLTFGEGSAFSGDLLKIAKSQAVKQGIALKDAQQFVFNAISRGLTMEEAGEIPALRFLTDKPFGLSLAADVQRQFGKELSPQGASGIMKILSGFLVAAKPTKATLEQVGGLIARPSQFARNLGFGPAETLAASGVAVAGVKNMDEASTQIRAFFQEVADMPALFKIAREEGLVPLLEAIRALGDVDVQKMFPDVRSAAGAMILSRNLEMIADQVPKVAAAMESSAAVLQQIREAQFDPRRQLAFMEAQAISARDIAQRETLGPRAGVISTVDAIVEQAIAEARGDTLGGRAAPAFIQSKEFFARPFMTQQQIIEQGKEDVRFFAGSHPQLEAMIQKLDEINDSLKPAKEENFEKAMGHFFGLLQAATSPAEWARAMSGFTGAVPG